MQKLLEVSIAWPSALLIYDPGGHKLSVKRHLLLQTRSVGRQETPFMIEDHAFGLINRHPLAAEIEVVSQAVV